MRESGRSARKHREIIEAAREVFLSKGYGGASMDEIAALAAVSKQTVYKHFADKERLFTEIITGDIDDTESQTMSMIADLPNTTDLAGDLRRFARRHVVEVTRPHLVRLRRIIIAEADRFPELARTWYESAPGRARGTFAEVFRELAGRGLLRVTDPLLAAEHFNWLVLAIPLNKAMFNGSSTEFTPEELERYADEGVRVFLAAYAG